MTLCVCGSRSLPLSSRPAVGVILTTIAPTALFTGGAKGADQLAGAWALANHIPLTVFPPDWPRWGRSAGKRRSAEMLAALPAGSMVVAFYHGFTKSRGTLFTVETAKQKGIKVIEYHVPT